MLNESFRYKIRNCKISKTIRKNEREIKFPSLNEIRTCGILIDNDKISEDLFNILNEKIVVERLFLKKLKRDKGDVSKAIFSSDLNFWGLPPNALIKEFVEKPFDILINFANEQNDVIDFIAARSSAKFKVSTIHSPDLYDLVINQQSISASEYINEIVKTLTNFSEKI